MELKSELEIFKYHFNTIFALHNVKTINIDLHELTLCNQVKIHDLEVEFKASNPKYDQYKVFNSILMPQLLWHLLEYQSET